MNDAEPSGDVLVSSQVPEQQNMPPQAAVVESMSQHSPDVFSQIKSIEAALGPDDGANRRVRAQREIIFKKVLHEQPDDVQMRLAVENDAFRRHYLKQKGEEFIAANQHDPEGAVIQVTALDRKILREAHKDDPSWVQTRLEPNVAGYGRTFKRYLATSHPDMAKKLADSDPYMRSVLNGTAEDVRKSRAQKTLTSTYPPASGGSHDYQSTGDAAPQPGRSSDEASEAWRLMDIDHDPTRPMVLPVQPLDAHETTAVQPSLEAPVAPEQAQAPVETPTTWLERATSGRPLSEFMPDSVEDSPAVDNQPPLATGPAQTASVEPASGGAVDRMVANHHESRDMTAAGGPWLWSDRDDHDTPPVDDSVDEAIAALASQKMEEHAARSGIVTNPRALNRTGDFRGVAPDGKGVVVDRPARESLPIAPDTDARRAERQQKIAVSEVVQRGFSRAVANQTAAIDNSAGTQREKEEKKRRLRLLAPILVGGVGLLSTFWGSSGGENPGAQAIPTSGTGNPGGYDSGAVHIPDRGYMGPLATTVPVEAPGVTPTQTLESSFVAPNQPDGDQTVPLSNTIAETTPTTQTEIDQKIDELLRIPMVDLHIDKPGDSISQSWTDEQGKSINEYKTTYYDDFEVTTADVMYNWDELDQAWSVIGGMPISFDEYMNVVDQAKRGDTVAIARLTSVNKTILDQQNLQLPNQIFRDFASPEGAKQFYHAIDSKDTLVKFQDAKESGEGVAAQTGSGETALGGSSINEEIGSTVAAPATTPSDQTATGGEAELGSVEAQASLAVPGDGTGIQEANTQQAAAQPVTARRGLGGFISGLFGGGQNRQ